MAANIEEFVTRLLRVSKKLTFVFTESFFDVTTATGLQTDKFKAISNMIRHVGHRRGEKAEQRTSNPETLFDVEVVLVRPNYTCYATSFNELATGPFGQEAFIYGYGNDMVDVNKARFMLQSFFSEKQEQTMTVSQMLNERKQRRFVVVADGPADLKRPSLEQVHALRAKRSVILISPVKGPIADCQVTKVSDSENSNSLSTLLSVLSVKY
ncbi:MAG: hypothetical protein ACRC10_02385 [Thermoguttaceae bacterium]